LVKNVNQLLHSPITYEKYCRPSLFLAAGGFIIVIFDGLLVYIIHNNNNLNVQLIANAKYLDSTRG